MHLSDLKNLHVGELIEMAVTNEIDGANRLRKQELIFALLKNQAKKGESIFGGGTLEVLPDGFGFLRSPDTSYLAGTDDIYVSPSQIRRFNLHTGDTIEVRSAPRRTASAILRWSRSTRSTTNRPRIPSTRSCSRT
jgi:transcription termination factor Rho